MGKRVLLVSLLIALAFVSGMVALRFLRPLPKGSGRMVSETSDDWGTIPFGDGECALVNNTWNREATGPGFEQSVFVEDVGGHPAAGWRWRAPWHLLPRVVSQPQIVCGNKPWDPKTRPDDCFPFRAGTKRLAVNFDVRLRARGVYNMAFSLWGVSGIPGSRSNITHEIMIWMDHSGQSPAGRRVDSIAVDGITYEVYVEPQQKDASGQNANTWTYVAFVPSKPVLRGPLDISAFLDYLLRHGTLTGDRYLTSLEFGSEVSQGSGIAEILDFLISVN